MTRLGFTKIHFSSYRANHKRGVAILISNKISFVLIYEHKDKEGRFVLIKGAINGQIFTLLSVYAPPGNNICFFKTILDLIVNHSEGTLICGGDFNTHLQPKLDVSSQSSGNKVTNTKFCSLMKNIGIIDIWREMFPTARQYTHYSNPHSVYTRIDNFFYF